MAITPTPTSNVITALTISTQDILGQTNTVNRPNLTILFPAINVLYNGFVNLVATIPYTVSFSNVTVYAVVYVRNLGVDSVTMAFQAVKPTSVQSLVIDPGSVFLYVEPKIVGQAAGVLGGGILSGFTLTSPSQGANCEVLVAG